MDLENKLTSGILNMIAGNLDRWQPDADPEAALTMMRSAHLVAQGIAKKLADGIRLHSGELDSQSWRRIAEGATRQAFIEIGDCGPLIKLGEANGFAEAVAESTTPIVAPTGSDWGSEVKNESEQKQRAQLKKLGLPSAEIEKAMQQMHALRRSGEIL